MDKRQELVAIIDSMNCSNAAQSAKYDGSPAVGMDSKILVRTDAMPVSSPSQNGDDALSATKWGR